MGHFASWPYKVLRPLKSASPRKRQSAVGERPARDRIGVYHSAAACNRSWFFSFNICANIVTRAVAQERTESHNICV
jgi:hypothetical protein